MTTAAPARPALALAAALAPGDPTDRALLALDAAGERATSRLATAPSCPPAR